MSRSLEQKCKKIAHIFVKSGIDLGQTNTEIIIGPFYTYLRIGLPFTSENAPFCDNL